MDISIYCLMNYAKTGNYKCASKCFITFLSTNFKTFCITYIIWALYMHKVYDVFDSKIINRKNINKNYIKICDKVFDKFACNRLCEFSTFKILNYNHHTNTKRNKKLNCDKIWIIKQDGMCLVTQSLVLISFVLLLAKNFAISDVKSEDILSCIILYFYTCIMIKNLLTFTISDKNFNKNLEKDTNKKFNKNLHRKFNKDFNKILTTILINIIAMNFVHLLFSKSYCFYTSILTKCQIKSHMNENYENYEKCIVNIIINFTAFLLFTQISKDKSLNFYPFWISYYISLNIYFFKVNFVMHFFNHTILLQNFPSLNIIFFNHGS